MRRMRSRNLNHLGSSPVDGVCDPPSSPWSRMMARRVLVEVRQ